MFNGPFRDASLFYASYVPSGGRYQPQCSIQSRSLLLHSSFLGWTIVTAFCFDFLPTSSRDSSLFRTLLHGSSSESEDQSIYSHAHQPSLAAHPRAHRLQSTALHLAAYSRVSPVSPTRHQDDGCGLLYRDVSHHLEVPPVRLSTVGKRGSQLPVANICGTTSRSTSHLHNHSPSSDSVSRLSSSLVPTRTS